MDPLFELSPAKFFFFKVELALCKEKTCYKLVDCLWKGYKPTERVSPLGFSSYVAPCPRSSIAIAILQYSWRQSTQGETQFVRGGGASANRGSFTQRVIVSCSALRGRGGAFNCLVGACDLLLFFLPLAAVGRSPPARGSAGRDQFRTSRGHVGESR